MKIPGIALVLKEADSKGMLEYEGEGPMEITEEGVLLPFLQTESDGSRDFSKVGSTYPFRLFPFAVIKSITFAVVFVLFASIVSAQTVLFITPTDGFELQLTAALLKQHVPVSIVTDKEKATLVLTANQKTSKTFAIPMKCLVFALVSSLRNCSPGQTDDVSGGTVITQGDAVVWAYEGKKGKAKDVAEDIAKHLKSEYFGGKK